MINKELKKLNRKDLLQILIFKEREIEQLKDELKLANEKLESREIKIRNSGSIAEAALKINHIFENAEAAAQQYIESIKKMEQIEEERLQWMRKKELEIIYKLKKLGIEETIY